MQIGLSPLITIFLRAFQTGWKTIEIFCLTSLHIQMSSHFVRGSRTTNNLSVITIEKPIPCVGARCITAGSLISTSIFICDPDIEYSNFQRDCKTMYNNWMSQCGERNFPRRTWIATWMAHIDFEGRSILAFGFSSTLTSIFQVAISFVTSQSLIAKD